MSDSLPSMIDLAGSTASSLLPQAKKAAEAFEILYATVARLRAPDGCPWDREQSPRSIRNNIIEEAYELVEAITEGDRAHVREETGDLFMLAAMVAYMNEEEGAFTGADALRAVAEKLVRRHPHVFGESPVNTAEGVVVQWNQIKEQKEGRRRKDSILDEVPRHLPPLEKAYKLQKKAAKAGFDWAKTDDVWAKFSEELEEARSAVREADGDRLEEELGDLLFTAVNLARHSGIDPALALQRTNEKFARRFRHVETRMKEENLPFEASQLERMDSFWEDAKKIEERHQR